MRYGCLEGGKRLRPFLMLNAASLFGVDEARALRVAAAIEAAHCYSLIHDDLPCMDNADLRRGKPTVHRAFDEVTAVLAGDALQALAFDILAHEDTHTDARVRVQLVQGLARALGAHGMVGGQVLDLIGEKEALPLGAITRMQRMKTGALFTFCCEAGGVMGRASSKHMLALRNYASDFGLAFQLTDDLLDKHGVVAQTGKDVGKDVRKSTFVRILGPEEARKKAEILIAQAIEHLGVFGPRAQNLVDLAQFVLDRKG
jgi:farnesyl diphosphate synthase